MRDTGHLALVLVVVVVASSVSVRQWFFKSVSDSLSATAPAWAFSMCVFHGSQDQDS